MAPQSQPLPLFSPSELAYLHTSLSLQPPIRPDGRSPTTFRPLSAETDIVGTANGSARLFYADGTEAIVGVKGEVQRSTVLSSSLVSWDENVAIGATGGRSEGVDDGSGRRKKADEQSTTVETTSRTEINSSSSSWVEVTLDIPGTKDDDATVVFLARMIHEGIMADGVLLDRLRINRRWHWKLFVDVILLLSPPHTYPLPLLSLTTHLALLTTRLPALVSNSGTSHNDVVGVAGGGKRREEQEAEAASAAVEVEDPLFNDDWDAAIPLYTHTTNNNNNTTPTNPPIALLVAAVADNIFFDPSGEELAVADAVVAVTITTTTESSSSFSKSENQSSGKAAYGHSPEKKKKKEKEDDDDRENRGMMRVVAVRMVDPPARLSSSATTEGTTTTVTAEEGGDNEAQNRVGGGIWHPRRGGVSRPLLKRMVRMCVEPGGVGEEVMRGLSGFL